MSPRGSDVDPTDEEMAVLLGERSHYVLRIDGSVLVPWFLEDQRVRAHTLMQLARETGFQVFYREVVAGEDPDVEPLNRRWTLRRVSLETVCAQVIARPGVKFDDLVELLYAETPWTDQARRNGRNKLRNALHRLRLRGEVVRRFDEHGVERWQPPGVATGLRLTPAGPSAPRPDERHLPLTPLVDGLEAGAEILKTYGLFSAEALRRDPTLYLDLVRQVFEAVTAHQGDSP